MLKADLDKESERFVKAVRTALIGPPELSQRDLCKKLDCTIGSLSKYLRGEVHPSKVGFGIQCRLAKVLGHSADALQNYYSTGEWTSEMSLADVVSYIRSDAGQEDLPEILESMQAMARRNSGQVPAVAKKEPWLWPLTSLKEAKVSDRMREKLGLTDEKLWALANEGVFDDDMVEAFSIACNLEETAVREAFETKTAIA